MGLRKEVWDESNMGKIAIIATLICFAIFVLMIYAVAERESAWKEFVEKNNCDQTGEKRVNHVTQPTYVMIGSVMTPVGGGVTVYDYEYICDGGENHWH